MRTLLLFAFFFSGFASLVLENIWVRMMTLVFGGSTLAVVTVLASFMGGIALGSYVAGRLSQRLRRPIHTYGLLECCVALYALALPMLVQLLPHVYAWLPTDWPFLLTAFVRFLLCTLLLLFPTTLMGATLPILSLIFVQRTENIGVETGILYGINTLGAVAGAWFGGFVFLPYWGHQKTLWLTSLGLFALGLCMAVYGRSQTLPVPQTQTTSTRPRTALQKGILWIIGLTGALAMICQVLWSRVLAMVVGSSSYAFSLILGIFLMGLALGALIGSRILRRNNAPTRYWMYVLIAASFSVMLGIWSMDLLPVLFTRCVFWIRHNTSHWMLFGLKAFIAGLPMLIPTLCMGAFFPFALALYKREESSVGEQIGEVYAANTLGSIVGSIAAGFIVIPWLGLQTGLKVCAALYLVAAGILFALRSRKRVASFAVVLFICGLPLLALPAWNLAWMSMGMYRVSAHRFNSMKRLPSPGHILFYKEGISATVSVHGTTRRRSLKINGKTDASSHGDWMTQAGIAALPLLAHKAPKDVALVGWGSGITAGAALQFPIRNITAVELEKQVIEASKLFSKWNYAPHLHPKLTLRTNDGRNYLASTQRTFDVIISEPSNPWISGMANLFTTEYFKLTQKRLRKGGIFCQWLQFYELSQANIVLILQTLQKVYPYVYILEPEYADPDKILLASNEPITLSKQQLQKAFKKPKIRSLLRTLHIHSPQDLVPRFILGGSALRRFLKAYPSQTNTDRHNTLEFSAPLDLVRSSTTTDAAQLSAALRSAQKTQETRFLPSTSMAASSQPAASRPTSSLVARSKRGKTLFNQAVSYLLFGHLQKATSLLKRSIQLDARYARASTHFHQLIRLSRWKISDKVNTYKHLDPQLNRSLTQLRRALRQGALEACHKATKEMLHPLTTAPLTLNKRPFWKLAAICAFERRAYLQALHYLSKK